jgi:hypothetical protein
MIRVTGTECERLALVPVIVKLKVPVLADGLGLIVSIGLTVPLVGVVTGLALKEALVRDGTPLTLSVTELGTPPNAPRAIV